MMKAVATTADIPAGKRFNYWQDAVCDVFVELDCRPVSHRRFFGEIATARCEDLHFSVVRSCDQNVLRTPSRIRAAREEVLLISVQMSGTGMVIQDGREARLQPGDFACYDSTRPYTLSFNEDFEQLVLHMPRGLLLERLGRTELLTARAVRGTSPVGSLVFPYLRQVASVVGEVDAQTAARLSEVSLALVTTALGELVQREHQGAPDARSWTRTALTYRAKAFIEEQLHDPDLTPAKVADAVGISLRYLQLLFHAENAAVSDWIWARRLERSRRRLIDPLLAHESIAQVAFGCGFAELAHFSRRFKAAYAASPRDYRAARVSAGKS
jgi:AraC-like DNA-binding protein